MKHFTKLVSLSLAKKLKKAGFPQRAGMCYYLPGECTSIGTGPEKYPHEAFEQYKSDLASAPTYASVFDWFMEKEIAISLLAVFIGPHFVYDWEVYSPKFHEKDECYQFFEGAADDAIEEALKILKESK